eukprot:TRINITY_DN1275_c1_g3_i1.p1 TRINITY_DN1275_c1_g3~~TRINITY_DN1275_c1_g3_i1.p1  ORF type:complete len:784 (+),score=112.20 TRINITY_DN1275_c1_g3_i1:226-2577(+)
MKQHRSSMCGLLCWAIVVVLPLSDAAVSTVSLQAGILRNLKNAIRASKPAETKVARRVSPNTLQHLKDVESSMLALLDTKQSSYDPAAVAFAEKVLTLTSQEMKPAILAEKDLIRDQLDSHFKAEEACNKNLENSELHTKRQWGKMGDRKVEMDQCIITAMVDAGLLKSRISSLARADWNYISFELAKNRAKLSGLSGYITGDFTRKQVSPYGNCGTGTQILTKFTCEEMRRRCDDFIDFDSKDRLDFCMDNIPAYVDSNVSAKCLGAGGPQSSNGKTCCGNPDTRVCDVHSGYKTQGDYYLAMFDYWDSMMKGWEKARSLCADWCGFCMGNQSICAINPPDETCLKLPLHRKKVSMKPLATKKTASTPKKISKDKCVDFQDSMDYAACDGAMHAIDSCNSYNECYKRANTSLTGAYITVCGDYGDHHLLKHEWYAVMRIECLVNGLNSSTPEVKVGECINKDIAAYDLSAVNMSHCDNSAPTKKWPQPSAGENSMCKTVSKLDRLTNISGSSPYKKTYYRNMKHVSPCQSHCCIEKSSLSTYTPLKSYDVDLEALKDFKATNRRVKTVNVSSGATNLEGLTVPKGELHEMLTEGFCIGFFVPEEICRKYFDALDLFRKYDVEYAGAKCVEEHPAESAVAPSDCWRLKTGPRRYKVCYREKARPRQCSDDKSCLCPIDTTPPPVFEKMTSGSCSGIGKRSITRLECKKIETFLAMANETVSWGGDCEDDEFPPSDCYIHDIGQSSLGKNRRVCYRRNVTETVGATRACTDNKACLCVEASTSV